LREGSVGRRGLATIGLTRPDNGTAHLLQ
jgi:hypothetical protein